MTDTSGIEYTTIHDWRPSYAARSAKLSAARQAQEFAWAKRNALIDSRELYSDEDYYRQLEAATLEAITADANYLQAWDAWNDSIPDYGGSIEHSPFANVAAHTLVIQPES